MRNYPPYGPTANTTSELAKTKENQPEAEKKRVILTCRYVLNEYYEVRFWTSDTSRTFQPGRVHERETAANGRNRKFISEACERGTMNFTVSHRNERDEKSTFETVLQ